MFCALMPALYVMMSGGPGLDGPSGARSSPASIISLNSRTPDAHISSGLLLAKNLSPYRVPRHQKINMGSIDAPAPDESNDPVLINTFESVVPIPVDVKPVVTMPSEYSLAKIWHHTLGAYLMWDT